MKIAKFKSSQYGELYPHSVIVTREPNCHITWTQYRKLARLTGEINFKCGFDKEGKCKGSRDSGYSSWLKGPQCCCKNCSKQVGYLDRVSEAQAETMKKLWDKKLGFWREGEGCILPRKYRSPTCLTFLCPHGRKYHRSVLYLIEDILRDGRPWVRHQKRTLTKQEKLTGFETNLEKIHTQLEKGRFIKCQTTTSS